MIKVHDKVTFPFIFNGNDYLNGFEGIKNKKTDIKTEKKEEMKVEIKPSVKFDIGTT
jgi:hypothetical protein